MFSFPCIPLEALLYISCLGFPKVLFGGLIYFSFIHKKKNISHIISESLS